MKNGVYSPNPIGFENELDKLKKIIYLYSCNLKVRDQSSVVIRPKLVTLLALYLQRGYNKETRTLGAQMLNVNAEAVNSMNLEIRNLGLLHKDTYNTRINHLDKDLVLLKEYLSKEDPDKAYILFRMEREKKNRV